MTDVRRGRPAFVSDLNHDLRLRASVERLLRADYEVPGVIQSTLSSDWPGDLAGRLLLSLSRYARADAGAAILQRASALNDALLLALADRGYLGEPFGNIADEQQVACHGWLTAGLLQYYYVTGDDRSRAAAHRVLDTLIVPALARRDYPWERAGQADVGEPSGTATEVVGSWTLSSDVWCVLLTLNGLVPVAIDSGRDDLAAIIDDLAEVIGRLDVVAHRAQLHAVLAASRNLADWAVATSSTRAAEVAASLYDVSARAARTLNYATFNWFGRPDTWTEPCAIVDSLGAATALHHLTGEARYRIDATRIARNGLDFAERKDGSFGLDTVATPASPILKPIAPDAHWCCTMRGAIGLLEARETAAIFDGEVVRVFDLYPGTHVIESATGEWRVHQSTAFPASAGAGLDVVAAPAEGSPLRVEVTIEEARSSCELAPIAGTHAETELTFATVREDVLGGAAVVRIGPVMQAVRIDLDESIPVPLASIAGTFDRDETPHIRLIADP